MMKRILKWLYYSTVKLIDTSVSIASVVFFSRHSKQNLKKYRNLSNKKILILGNGPSLLKSVEEFVDYFKTNVLMVVNGFFDSPLIVSFKPQYYIIIDPVFFREGVAYADNKQIEKFINFMNNVDWELKVIVPFEFRNSYTKNKIDNKKLHYIYINRTPIKGVSKICHWLYKKNCGMPFPMNVLNAAIFCSINLGFQEIELYGADHSWLKDIRVNRFNETCMKDSHFFDEENHLRIVKGFDITKLLDHFATTFNSHKLLQKYAMNRGVDILNCTPGSFIDAYPRKEGC